MTNTDHESHRSLTSTATPVVASTTHPGRRHGTLAAALWVASLIVVAGCDRPARPSATPAPSRTAAVLFIGNSLTFYHDMPGTFRAYVEAAYPGTTVETHMVALPGESLKGHWDTGEALRRIESRPWDYVVLQEHGGLQAHFWVDGETKIGPPEAFLDYARRFSDAITERGATPVFYLTASNQEDLRPTLEYAYTEAAKAAKGLLAPAGLVFESLRDHTELTLYDPDGGHPSPQGSYLVAVTIAQTLFGSPSAPAPQARPKGVSSAAATTIEAAVARLRQARAELGPYPPVPTPRWHLPPTAEPGDAMTPQALAGTWSAVHSGIALSLGSQLTVDFQAQQPRVTMHDFGVNAIASMPIENDEFAPDSFRFETEGNNRRYALTATLHGDELHVLVTQPRGKGLSYTNVRYVRADPDGYFAKLSQAFEQLARDEHQRGLEAALPAHYDALTGLLGKDALADRGLPDPRSTEWLLLMSANDTLRAGDRERALSFSTLAQAWFPDSPAACAGHAKMLEANDRLPEALAAAERAHALVAAREGGAQADPGQAEWLASLAQYIAELKQQIDAGR
ncbi:SGNH/GDSL hydrolase family protein [Haliangium sp.]|uniref:SGNH/GDSL hydrolase family protein n=1 Tax=Haliangium sp. TaxID=2663208 RepID=UPI003D0F1964